MKEQNKELSLSYLTQAIKYLHLAEAIFTEMKKQGNNWMITSDSPINNYEDLTKWSDFNVIFPSLFIFYHGIELSIKGLLMLSDKGISKVHKFSILVMELKKQEIIYNEITDIIEKYTNIELLKDTPLGGWLVENNLNVDNLYERLRYPTWGDDNNVLTNDLVLKYKGKEMIPFIDGIVTDVDNLRRLIVKQYRE